MAGAALAHLAAHGRVRSDNPQFGSLRFHDGPLMIYDLERLDRAPHTVIVAACDAGRPVVPVGDELLGLHGQPAQPWNQSACRVRASGARHRDGPTDGLDFMLGWQRDECGCWKVDEQSLVDLVRYGQRWRGGDQAGCR